MGRLIDADDLFGKMAFAMMAVAHEYGGDSSELGIAVGALRAVEKQPTVDAEPVRQGKWIDIDSQMYTWKVRCDQCGHERSMMSTQGRYPRYCENCGAKMDAQEEEV